MEQLEDDWQLLPRQARSMSSHQLQMQRQLSQVGWLRSWAIQTG